MSVRNSHAGAERPRTAILDFSRSASRAVFYDTDTGLVRFGARDYDALTGRRTGKDPI
jgi:hypothetical protein